MQLQIISILSQTLITSFAAFVVSCSAVSKTWRAAGIAGATVTAAFIYENPVSPQKSIAGMLVFVGAFNVLQALASLPAILPKVMHPSWVKVRDYAQDSKQDSVATTQPAPCTPISEIELSAAPDMIENYDELIAWIQAESPSIDEVIERYDEGVLFDCLNLGTVRLEGKHLTMGSVDACN